MVIYPTIESVEEALASQQYVADRGLATTLFLALRLQKPLFLEGEAGVGKTEIAKVLARLLDTKLIRLQCYEGIDVHTALYEWNVPRQLIHIRLMETNGANPEAERQLYSPEFLIKRPLLEALEATQPPPPVLLIDELDRADAEFEAFLLELLSDFQITIPELGPITAVVPPVVILTSNRTREINDALKRRCLYHWIDYPSLEKELRIVKTRVNDVPERLARDICAFVQNVRSMDLYKVPGVAETIDWAAALSALQQERLDPAMVDATLGALLKNHEDMDQVRRAGIGALVGQATK